MSWQTPKSIPVQSSKSLNILTSHNFNGFIKKILSNFSRLQRLPFIRLQKFIWLLWLPAGAAKNGKCQRHYRVVIGHRQHQTNHIKTWKWNDICNRNLNSQFLDQFWTRLSAMIIIQYGRGASILPSRPESRPHDLWSRLEPEQNHYFKVTKDRHEW